MKTFPLLSVLVLALIVSQPSMGKADTTLPAGNDQSFSNMQPSLALNYVVNILGDDDSLGEVGIFAGNFAPQGWAFANGELLDKGSYESLYSKLGTTFGGDGESTFALPDLRGRAPIGVDQRMGFPNYALGQKVGAQQTILSGVPEHQHLMGTGYLTDLTGGPIPHSNLQPSLALTPIIATQGVYPSQNILINSQSGPAPIGSSQEPFLGEVTWLAHTEVPEGWMLADGNILSIVNHQALFSILGTTYGGDGEVTFALPDLRGQIAVGAGLGPGLTNRNLGQEFGFTEETLTAAQMPDHSHPLPNNLGQTNAAGNGHAQSHLQPSLPLTPIIALQGTYPSQNITSNSSTHVETAAIGSGIDPVLGSIALFAGRYAPRGYSETDGQIRLINQDASLFSLLGTIYGGDGESNFWLPDLRGRAMVGADQPGLGIHPLGVKIGNESSHLNTSQLPEHTHNYTVIAGDYDLDGDVDSNDFLHWQLGRSPTPRSTADLSVWKDNYGDFANSVRNSSVVPEPASHLLALCLLAHMATCGILYDRR